MPQGGGVRGCKELREASMVTWWAKGLSTTDLATLWARYGSVLPALRLVSLLDNAGATAGPDGVQRLAEGLGAGALSQP